MSSPSRLLKRLRLVFGRRGFERDLDDELRFHMDMAASHRVARGASDDEARNLIRKEFGSMDRFKDEVRDARGLTLVALGARRRQIARQFLTESVALALFGAALGLGLARLALDLLSATASETLPFGGRIPLDTRVLLVLLGAAVLCGLAFGAVPALQLSAAKLRRGLEGLTVKTTASAESRRFRSALVVAQIAISGMLLVGAGLLTRAFFALQSTKSGIVAERVLTARLAVPRHYARDASEPTQVLRPLLERVRAIPGVRAAGVTSMLPIEETGVQASFWVDQRPWPKRGDEPLVEVRGVSPGYFTTMGVPVVAGRDLLESDDTTGVSKVVVNQALARELFPNENPIGRRLLQGSADSYDAFEIVGVVGDVKQSGLDVPARTEMYTSYADVRNSAGFALGDVSLVVKTTVSELSVVPQVRQALRDVARDVALTNVRPMEEVVARSLARRKLTLALFEVFAIVALALAASGLYGVTYYLVTQRTREIGIRVALGADKARVVNLVLWQGAKLVGGGIAIGLVGAFLLSRLLTGLLYGVGTRDPLTFTSVPLLLVLVATLATLVPAWRAARVDPVIAMRAE